MHRRPGLMVWLCTAAAGGVWTGSAFAGEADELTLAPARFEWQTAKSQEPPPAPEDSGFGAAGTTWASLGGGAAADGADAFDTNLYLRLSYFVVDNIEVLGEAGGWHYNQPGKDATGFNVSMLFRWHFYQTEKWTVYGDVGIGVLFATDPVPSDGTAFDFTPRAGVGFTRAIGDEGVRWETGLRWAHVSNGRISGHGENPARDSVMLYTGLIFPF